MKLSIIIPTYNCQKYIDKCLSSVVDSGNEIIVINDGSTDETIDILKKYKNIKIFNNENSGVSFSRNYGVKKATGEYIMFLDSDDYLLPNFNDILKENIKEDIIYITDGISEPVTKDIILEHIVGIKSPCIASCWSKLYRRKYLIDNNITFKENLINGEDMLFNIDCLINTKKIKIINDSIYMYRQNIFSATKKFDERLFLSDKYFHNYLKESLNNSNFSDIQKYRIINYCLMNAIVTIIDRLSYLDFKAFKENMSFIDDHVYENTLKIKNILNIKRNILIIFIKCKFYKLIYYIFRLKHKSKLKNEEYYIKI